jgi:ribokinase
LTVELVGFGALNRDVLYRVPEIVLNGETFVESSTLATGGSAANTCRALARWGVSTGFVGAVGDDPDGSALLAALRDSDVDVSHVAVKTGVPTGRVMGLVDPQGHRSLYVDPGANSHLVESDIPLETLAHTQRLHLASFVDASQLLLQEKVIKHLFTTQFTRSIADGVAKRALSFAPGQIYARLGRDRLAEILQRTEILFVNETEAEQLGGVVSLLASDCQVVVVTLGSRGSRIITAEGSLCTSAFQSDVVDTTGAGDAFAAGFLYGRLQGKALDTCARWGNWVASRVIQSPGADTGLPTAEALEGIS